MVPFSFRLTTQPFMLQLTRGTMVCYSCYYRQKLLLRIQGSLASKIRYRFLNSAWGNGGSGMGEWCRLKSEVSIKSTPCLLTLLCWLLLLPRPISNFKVIPFKWIIMYYPEFLQTWHNNWKSFIGHWKSDELKDGVSGCVFAQLACYT